MTDCQRAVAFVIEQGDEIERDRLRYLLSAKPPSRDTAASLFAGQRSDGGWAPFWAPSYSSVDATCFRLVQAEQLGLLDSEPVRQGQQFLRQRQSSDGSWEEDESVKGYAPPWVMPGDPMARLYVTANAGY